MLPALALLPFLLQATPDEARAAAQALPLPVIGDGDLAHWREVVYPSGDELTFERIPWIASFAEGLRAAEREQRPLLFWAMNGHPLGCT
jgi:hypothetical protein